MRMILAAVLVLSATHAMADENDDAHKRAITGRDTYWTCLAQEYSQDSNKGMSGPDFTAHIADVCPSERQYFRVALIDYLTTQNPDGDSGANLATANKAIALAQKDVVTAFVNHKAASK